MAPRVRRLHDMRPTSTPSARCRRLAQTVLRKVATPLALQTSSSFQSAMPRRLSLAACSGLSYGGDLLRPLGCKKVYISSTRGMYRFIYEGVADEWGEIVERHRAAIRARLGEIDD